MTQTKAKIMAATVRASDSGLEIIDKARRKKSWGKYEKVWADLARTSPATLKRFWQGLRIQTAAFQSICEIVGISDWESVAEFGDSNLDSRIGSKRLSFAIAGSVDEIERHKLEAITALLRKLSGDASIEILDIYEGSINLVLGGSLEGLERLEYLFDSGQLDKVVGIAVQNAHLLDKGELVRLIREKGNDIANLSGTDLSGTDLSGTDLSGTDLSGANLSNVYLSEANLFEANLQEADLIEADLSRAYLIEANLSGAYLSGAYLNGAYLNKANLSDADLSGAYLSRVPLSGANLSGAYLGGAYLGGTNLIEADLSRADLSRADLSGANLSDAYVQRTRFSFSIGLSEESIQYLVQRGAIFEDAPGEEAFVRSPVPSGRT